LEKKAMSRLSFAQSGALFGALLLTSMSSVYAKDMQARAGANRKVAELAANLQGEIASTFESTVPCDLRPQKKENEKEFEEIAPKSKIPLFQSREIADMEMDADFNRIHATPKGAGLTPGKIRYRLKNGKEVSVPVEIGVRSHSKQMICDKFQPLKLHFKKEDTKGTIFEHIGEHVKLATHCSGPGSHKITEDHSQIVVRESAAYQILEDNGIVGYKTRLVNMTYKDQNGKPVADGIGFFLEPDGKMAERWGYKHDKQRGGSNAPESGQQHFRLGMRLVGGSDHWDYHNTTALSKDGKLAMETFYDLDMSLIANPSWQQRHGRNITIRPVDDIATMMHFIDMYPEGPDAGKAFLERALARKEHTMSIVDQLPIETKTNIKERLKVWYGAIDNVLHNAPIPQAVPVNKEVGLGNYGRF
jgi:hypothetical protein